WAQQLEPKLLDLQSNQVQLINDDRLGRTLDKLFKSDRKSMLIRLMLHMVQEFDRGTAIQGRLDELCDVLSAVRHECG
ncbi:MAG: hypothetical protein V3V08_19250, partial [Nannocystaceae bacterium]